MTKSAEIVSAEMTAAEQIKKFVLAGKSVFTLQSNQTGNRFTYRVNLPKAKEGEPAKPHFVGVLTGPDNTHDYTPMGRVLDGKAFLRNRSSAIGPDAASHIAFQWFWERIERGLMPTQLKFYHEGRCGKCGLPLTDPVSIESGFGPVCRGR